VDTDDEQRVSGPTIKQFDELEPLAGKTREDRKRRRVTVDYTHWHLCQWLFLVTHVPLGARATLIDVHWRAVALC